MKKVKIGLSVIIFIFAIQWIAVKMVYAHKLGGTTASILSKVYNLKAGTIINTDMNGNTNSLNIFLYDYLKNYSLISKFADLNNGLEEEIKVSAVWDKLFMDAYVNNIAKKAELTVSNEEIEEQLSNINDLDTLKESVKNDLGLSFEEYKKTVVKSLILQSKVYDYLLDNYNDMDGMQKAQSAYEALEGGSSFEDVNQEYSSFPIEESMYLKESDLIDFYEPIKDLEIGSFSKIVKVTGGYVIWYLESITTDEESVWEIKGLFINAKTLEQFLEEYLDNSEINKLY